jgi:membrane-associated phospholipid phosphatase
VKLRPPRSAGALALTVLCCTFAPPARAADSLSWNPAWPRVSSFEYGLTAVAGTGALLLYFEVPDAQQPRWTGGILLDGILRDALRERSPRGVHAARSASDITALSTMAWALALDSIVVPLARRSPDVAGQLTSLNAESFSVSLLISTVIFKAVARARPSYVDCHRNPLFEPLCNSSVTASFPSGHTNAAFTAAGLSCAHHLHVGTYGDKLADPLACAGTLTLAAVTGTLRIMGDRHYATDVWLGAAIGFAVGYGLPTLFHYGRVSNDAQAGQAAQPVVSGFPVGPTIAGTF